MSALRRAVLAVAISVLVPASANAMDEYLRASSSKPTPIILCGTGDNARIKPADCKQIGYDSLVAKIDKALTAALAGTPANIRPLLKRDQAWFNETILEAAEFVSESDEFDLREQFGETLRVVIGDEEWRDGERPACEYMWQLTASYFASGKSDAADKADVTFVRPTFDCTRLETATEEEICADPDLADNDRTLNRAWKALLPRLDEARRRALTEDQRNWVRARANLYPQFLHPAWEKQSSYMHFTADARDKLNRLQRERIALLDGFDDKRDGLAGTWLAHNAVVQVTANADGSLNAKGWKWEQGDWKAGCDYEMKGKVIGGVFRSEEQRKNPDTLERDHAMLIVNRLDDTFARKRWKRDGTEDATADEAKCRRNLSNSSTARLFPARLSPDVDNIGGSIR